MKKLEQIKTHVRENKKTYVAAGVGVMVGVTGTLVLTNASAGNTAVQKVIAFKTGDVNQVVIQQLARRGHPGVVLKCVETGETFASIRRASEVLGVDRGSLQRHLKGLKDNVEGLTFEVLGEATK